MEITTSNRESFVNPKPDGSDLSLIIELANEYKQKAKEQIGSN